MGFGRYKNTKSADLVHRIELFDFATGDPAMANGRRQHITIRGEKSRAYQSAVEQETAQAKRKNKGAADFTFKESVSVLARRLSSIVVSAYVDAGDDEPDIIEFDDIDALPDVDRENEKHRLRNLFTEVSDLAVVVNNEVVKSANFLPGQGQTLSSLLNSKSGTEEAPEKETQPD